MKIFCIGAGSVGKYAALDFLASNYNVVATDVSRSALDGLLERAKGRLKPENTLIIPDNPKELPGFIKKHSFGCDAVALAVPGDFGYNWLKLLIENACPKYIVDVSFSPEDPSDLDELAKKKSKVVFVDAGVAPGLYEMLWAFMYVFLFKGKVYSLDSESAALELLNKFHKMFRFNAKDDLELYIRLVNYRENGVWKLDDGLLEARSTDWSEFAPSLPWIVDDPAIALLSECIRTSRNEFPGVPNLQEHTVRPRSTYRQLLFLKKNLFLSQDMMVRMKPNYAPYDFVQRMLFLSKKSMPAYEGWARVEKGWDGDVYGWGSPKLARETLSPLGFYDINTPLGLDGNFRPFDVTLKLLEKVWTPGPDDRDCTVMRVFGTGEYQGEDTRITYSMSIPYDEEHDLYSLAKATGAPFVSVMRLALSGLWKQTGIIGPAKIGGRYGLLQFIRGDLKRQGFEYSEKMSPLKKD